MANVTAKEQQTRIEWASFEPGFVRLETGVAKKLKLANWRQGLWFEKPGIRFDVLEEDGNPVSKVFTVTSKRLVRAMKPIITKAEAQGKKVIMVSITRVGDGLNTVYKVQSLEKPESSTPKAGATPIHAVPAPRKENA